MIEKNTVNAISFDVEEYYHALNFRSIVARASQHLNRRVEYATMRVLEYLADCSTRATFFVLGDVAKDHPNLVRTIADAGHEIASHGVSHKTVGELGVDAFRAEAVSSKNDLEDIIGRPVYGFRASTFSIVSDTLWALDVLWEAGYRYDSSIFPVMHDRYGIPKFSRVPVRIDGQDGRSGIEFPLLTLTLPGGLNLPVGGGGYFRLFPSALIHWAIRRMNASSHPAIIYLHPWEFDPDQPRHDLGGLKTFRHYVNLAGTGRRLNNLLRSFAFDTLGALAACPEKWAVCPMNVP